MFHSILFVQRGKEKLCSLNQPQHTSPEPEYFIGFKESPFAPPLLSQDCFLHPSFECKWCHWVGAPASCPQAWHSTGQESCSSAVIWPVQHSQGELPTSKQLHQGLPWAGFFTVQCQPPKLGFNFVQWTYRSQGSIRLIAACSLAATQLQL